jgi:hypothetical protein
MDGVQSLQRLGWSWHQQGIGAGTGPGVMIQAQVNGRTVKVFIPLSRVWLTFDEELQRVGCPSAASVGAPFSVGGFFDFVKKAASSVVRKVVPKAIQRAATRVVATAKKFGAAAYKGAKAVASNPVFRGAVIAASFAVPALAPAAAALEIANRAAKVYAAGQQAAKAIKAGVNTAQNIDAVRRGLIARQQVQAVVQRAHAGDPRAKQLVGAFQSRLGTTVRQSPGGQAAMREAGAVAQRLASRPQFAQAANVLRSFF